LSSVGFWPRRKAASNLWWWSLWSFILNFWCWWYCCLWFWVWWCSYSRSKSIASVAREIESHNVIDIKSFLCILINSFCLNLLRLFKFRTRQYIQWSRM